MNINIETKYKIGDMVKVHDKDIGVIECLEIRQSIEGTFIKYTVHILSHGSTIKSSWCNAKDLSPFNMTDIITASDI